MELSRLPGVYWLVTKRLAAGPHPIMISQESLEQTLQTFVGAGISSVIDLTEAGEIVYGGYYKQLAELTKETGQDLRYQRFAIPDMGVPTQERMTDLVAYLRRELNAHRTVYLHCLGGLGRTGTVAACYLASTGLSGDKALAELRKLRVRQGEAAESPENQAQRDFVKAWIEKNTQG